MSETAHQAIHLRRACWTPSTQLLPSHDPGESGRGRVMHASPPIPRKPGFRAGIKDQLVQRSGLVWCFEDGAGGDLVVLKPGCRAGVMGREQTSHRDACMLGCWWDWMGLRWAAQLTLVCFCAYYVRFVHPLTSELTECHYFIQL